VIVPSLKDTLNLFPLPQPQFHKGLTTSLTDKFKAKLHFASNPQEIKIHNYTFSVINTDIILNFLWSQPKFLQITEANEKISELLEAYI